MSKKIDLIEFLRAISVIGVILFHYFPDKFPLGYLGVDVFFVISGYVIMNSLSSKEISWNSIKLFYNKRAHRLLPLLYFVLTFTLIISFFIDAPHATKNIGQGIVATTLNLANIFYFTEIDYFNQFQETSPLVHTWSLSLEEQFYIFFPIILLFTKNNQRIIILSFLLLASFLLFLKEDNLVYNHYMTHHRIWQLLVGSILALSKLSFYNNLIHYLSLSITLFVLFSTNVLYPNILIVLFTVITILFQPKFELYNFTLFIQLGSLSYSLYLWHQPIMYFNSILFSKSSFNFSCVIFFIFFVSFFSNKLIENKWRYKLTRMSILYIFVYFLFLFSFGYLSHLTNGFFNLKKIVYSVQNIPINIDHDELLFKRTQIRNSILNIPVKDSTVLIIGDSKAEDLLFSLYQLKKIKYNLIRIHSNDYDKKIFFTNKEILNSLKKANKIIFTNTWQRSNINNVKSIINDVASMTHKKIYVLSTSNFEDLTSQYFSYYKNKLSNQEIHNKLNHSVRLDWERQSDELRDKLINNQNIFWIDKKQAFLGDFNGFCVNNELTIYDTGHLTSAGFIYFGQWILSKIDI